MSMIPKAFAEELTVLVNKHGIEYLVNMPDFILSGMICRMLEVLGPCIMETLEWHGRAPFLLANTSPPPLDITDMDKPCSAVALHRAEDFQSREIILVCPDCGQRLERVTRSSGSMLNMYQFASIRAGDWYCKGCPDNGRGRSGFRYFWDSEVCQKEEEKMVTSFNAEFFVRNALQDTDGLSKYVTKVIEQLGKHTKSELVSIRDELKVVKASSASEAGAVAIMLEVINQLGVVESMEGQ